MKSKNVISLALLIAATTFNSLAQQSTTIPLNEKVISGVLPNKMHYYIMRNEFPKDRVSFYFPQNVGSILEDDSQKGLAHFLEHMAFNGTQHFAGKGFLDMLQKEGVRFGADINAYTGYDETVYNISNVPVANEWLIDSCLYVLHDWSGALLLQDNEIDNERGVIREEWRTRRNSFLRIYEQTSQVTFKGSKYTERMPIGDIDIINNFKYQELRDYYQKWYRPDLQAVVVVGDIDPVKIEEKVKAIFSEIPLTEERAERGFERIPDHSETYFCLATDKEAKFVNMIYQETSDKPQVKDENFMREDRINSLIFDMFNTRLQEYIQNSQTEIIGAQAGFNSITRLQRNFYLYIVPKPAKEITAYREAFTEWERARRYGFTQAELDRSIQNTLSGLENFVANQDKVENDKWARQIYEYFLHADPFVSPETELNLQKKLMAEISLTDVNQAIKSIQTGKNPVLTVSGPEATENPYPVLADFEQIMTEVKATQLEAYAEEDLDTPLVTDDLKPVSIQKQFDIAGIKDAKGYILANGAKVVVYPTDLAQDEILFSAFSFGGSSLLEQDDLASAEFAVSVVEDSGLGDFKATDLSKKLTGKILNITPFLSDNTEGFKGSTNMKDFNSLTQLIYLYFTKPRFDKTAYQKIIDQYEAYLKNASADNQKAMRDTISMVSANYSPRALTLNQALLDAVSFEKASKVYANRFRNASDFTFVFVGNITDEMLSDIQTYIGNIPSTDEKESFVDHQMYPASGENKREVLRTMDTPKTTVYLNLSGELAKEKDTKVTLYYIGQLLSKKYLDIIREEEGGSYGVGVGASLSAIPSSRYSVTINFDTDPEKRERLMQVVYEQIDAIKNGTIDMADFNEIKASVLNMREQGIKTNKFWLADIVDFLQTSDEIWNEEEYKALIDSITPKSISALASQIFASPDKVEVIMNPATTQN